jgi:CRISPR-associated protein Cas1
MSGESAALDVVLDSRGVAVRRHRQRFAVRIGEESREWAADDVRQLVLGPSQMISTDALALAAETSTDVVVLDWRGDFVGRFVPASLSGAALVKRAQLEAGIDARGVTIATGLVAAKCRNQQHLLRAVDAEATVEPREAIARLLARRLDFGPTLAIARPLLFAMEGQAGRSYMDGLKKLLPAGLGFDGRNRRPPRDVVNAALSYGYAILCGQTERALALSGFEPSLGFLHTDRWGKPSLTLDFVELFRQPIVDRAVLTLARRRQLGREQGEEHEDGGVLLSADGRRLVAAQVLERLNDSLTYRGKRVRWQDVLVHEARHLAGYLLGRVEVYRPYVHRWT